jgi:hypothetical protein
MPARRAGAEPSDPFCPSCSKRVTSGSLVLFQHGELLHVGCASRKTQMRAREESKRAASAQASAAESVARAKQVIEEAARVRRKELGPCGDCGQPFQAGDGYLRRSDGREVHLTCPRPR